MTKKRSKEMAREESKSKWKTFREETREEESVIMLGQAKAYTAEEGKEINRKVRENRGIKAEREGKGRMP